MEFDNPYFEELAGDVTVGPNRAALKPRHVQAARRWDAELTEHYAWGIPNTDAIDTLVEHDPILEVGAGNGYWAWCVEQAGGDIVATDSLQDVDGEPDPWTDVGAMDYREAMHVHGGGRTLFICWPNYGDRWAHNAIELYEEIDGRTFIYVGESRGGKTGCEAFHRRLYTNWELTETVDIPTVLPNNDRMEVWER